MKVVKTADQSEFMHTQPGEPAVFANPYIQKGFENSGIAIPPGLVPDYNGKQFVYLEDPEFEKAFRELYFALEMDQDVYRLIEN